MATSAGSLYVTGGIAGVDLTKTRTSAQGPQFPIKTRVTLNNGRIGMYVLTSSVIGPSATVSLAGTDGTITMTAGTGSAGAFITMNDITTDGHTYLWVRTSNDQLLP